MKRLVYLFNCFVFIMILQSCDNEIVNDGESMQQENIEALTKSVAVVCVDLFVQWDGEFLFLGSSCSGGGSSGGGGHGSITDGYNDRDIIESPSYPSDWSGGSGGSTHYNPSTGNQEYVYDNLTHIYAFGSTLDLAQKQKLNQLMGVFKSTSKNKELYDYMIDNNVKIKFHINPTSKYYAYYECTSKSITIRDIHTLAHHQFQEELFHAVQHQCFYGNSMLDDYKNFEFEAKVFFDIFSAMNGFYDNFIATYSCESPTFNSKYRDWIEGIVERQNGRFTDTKGFIDLCTIWPVYKGETLTNFRPSALLHFYRKPVPPPKPFNLMNMSINYQ